MNIAETIHQKVLHLPPQAQEEALEQIEKIEDRYHESDTSVRVNGGNEVRHPLDLLAEIQIDGPPDLSERHDFYAHGKLED